MFVLFAACTETINDLDPDAPVDIPNDASVDGAMIDAMDVPEPDFTTIAWQTVGTGVSFKDSQNPRGENVFIAYAGYGVNDAQARIWVTALYQAALRERGVRYVYAVRGPMSVEYLEKEIQNSKLIAKLLPQVSDATKFIAIAGHSSGGWVACEVLQQLFEGGLDPMGKTNGRTVYYDLDGVQSCVDSTMSNRLRKLYFIGAHTNAGGGGNSLNASYMMMGAMRLGLDKFKLYDASNSGCQASAALCLHVTLVNTKPHSATTGTPGDYGDFVGRPVNHWYLDSYPP